MSTDPSAQVPEDRLSEKPVTIHAQSGAITVPGLVHEACPGLAVTMHPFGVFAVTSTKNGVKLCNIYQRASTALLAMSWWALIADAEGKSWEEMSPEDASAMMTGAKDKAVPFEGCTSSSQGETRKMTVGEWFQHQRMPVHDEFPWEEKDPYEMALENLDALEVTL
jgi:hypothetical protein